MGLGRKSKRPVPPLPTEPHFVCSASSLDHVSSSRKHRFTAENAERLMKKHMKKKPRPITISCTEDRMLFRAQSGSHMHRRSRTYAKYADIRHFFIYSLNPSFFMLCLEESDNGGKKCYESFRGENAEDVQRLCELTARAQQSGTNTLPIPDDPKYSTVKESDVSETEVAKRDSITHGPSIEEEKESPYASPLRNTNVKALRYDLVDSPNNVHDNAVNINYLNKTEYYQSYNPKYESATHAEFESIQPAMSNNVATQPSGLKSPNMVYHSPVLLIRDSRRASKKSTLKVSSNKSEPIYLTYQRSQFDAKPTRLIYGREELTRIFGDDVTYFR